jgi:hypothetical protein
MRLTPKQAASWFRKKSVSLPKEILRAEKRASRVILTHAKTLSKGKYTLAQLARMGHPYSRKHPNPPQDPAIINFQTGRFLHSWRVSPVIVHNGEAVFVVSNPVRHSQYLRPWGTRKMIGRPVEVRLVNSTEAFRYLCHVKAISTF